MGQKKTTLIRPESAVCTSVIGTNADLIERVAKLYLKPGMRVADVTFGRGVFWKKIDLGILDAFTASDIAPADDATVVVGAIKKFPALIHKCDFRLLPPEWDGWYDVVVLDPPYMHGGATVKASISKCYGNRSANTKAASHEAILALYHDGMMEAWRVLKPGGLLWVKCQDEIESGRQRWSHIEIADFATRCVQTNGYPPFEIIDLFVLVQGTTPAMRFPYQHHARKNHSYLWVLRKKL